MNLTQEYLNQQVRRVVFSLRKPSGEYVHIFSILEKIEEDMQDYNAFSPNQGKEYNDYIDSAPGKEDKIYLTVDKITITKPFFDKPWDNYYSGKHQLQPCTENYRWPAEDNQWRILPSDENNKTELKAILPRRTCPSYVRYCIPTEVPAIINHILTTEKLRLQLKELSERNLGYDITVHKNLLGGFFFLTYNNIYRKIDFTEKETRDGIYCRVDYKGNGQPLTVICTRRANDDGVVGMDQFPLDGNSSLYELTFKGPFHSLEVNILDREGDLIDFYNRLVFIHSINFDMRLGDQEVHVLDEDGNTIKTVQKFTEADRTVIGEIDPTKGLLDSSPEYAYREFEKALDFVFYDGDKNTQKENLKKSTADVIRILNTAHERIYICDTFFDAKALGRFVLPMESRSVPVRILSGKKELKSDGKRLKLAEAINEMNGKGISNITCRLLIGKKAELHDRFIVADDQVWMLGCSLNEFGDRATTLIRVPKDYRQKLVDRAEKWWEDEDLTENINDAKKDDTAKRRCLICKWLDKLCRR